MKIVKLKDIAKITTGKTPSTKDKGNFSGIIPFVKPPDLGNSTPVTKTTEYLSPQGAKSANILPKNSIMICCIGSLGKVGIAGSDLATNQQINSLTFDPTLVNYKFGYYFALTLVKQLKQMANSAVVPIVNKSAFSNLDFKLIPLDSQNHIVKILDEADALRQKRKQAIALLDDYLKAVFLDMFGDPVKNSKGWETTCINHVIKEIVAGWSANGEDRQKLQNEYGVLKISSVTYGSFNPQEYKAVNSAEISNKKLVYPKKGSILFGRANTRELVGASCIVADDYNDLFLPDKLWEIIIDTSKVNPVFFQKNISNTKWRNELAKKATGTSGSMLNISMDKFRNSQIIVPPMEMQIKFSEIALKIGYIKNKMLIQDEKLEVHFQALLQKAFNGELYV